MRRAFVWESVGGLTSKWHDGGGVLVVADDLDAARTAVRAHVTNVSVKGEKCSGLDAEPDLTFPADADPVVVIFEDAGCC